MGQLILWERGRRGPGRFPGSSAPEGREHWPALVILGPGHGCMTVDKRLTSAGLSFLISKPKNLFGFKILILGLFLVFFLLVSKTQ